MLDVALCYGAGFDGLATYLHAKHDYAERTHAFRHHVAVPAPVERHYGGWHELPQSSLQRHGRRRFSRRPRHLLDLLAGVAPDIVLLHGSFAGARGIVARAHAEGATVIGVPWRGKAAAAQTRVTQPGRARTVLTRSGLVDAVLASRTDADALAPRLGVDPVFRPLPHLRRGAQVLFVGELSRSSGAFDLVAAAAAEHDNRVEINLYGRGQHERALRRKIASYGLSGRVRVHPYLDDRAVSQRKWRAQGAWSFRGRRAAAGWSPWRPPRLACPSSLARARRSRSWRPSSHTPSRPAT